MFTEPFAPPNVDSLAKLLWNLAKSGLSHDEISAIFESVLKYTDEAFRVFATDNALRAFVREFIAQASHTIDLYVRGFRGVIIRGPGEVGDVFANIVEALRTTPKQIKFNDFNAALQALISRVVYNSKRAHFLVEDVVNEFRSGVVGHARMELSICLRQILQGLQQLANAIRDPSI